MIAKDFCVGFLVFLKRNYPLKRGVNIKLNCHPKEYLYMEKEDNLANAYVTFRGNDVEIDLATNRDFGEVFKSVAHEYKHCLQYYNELTWNIKGFCPVDSPLEDEARAFAEEAYVLFMKPYASATASAA